MHITRTKNKLSGKKTSHRRAVEKSLLLELIRNNSLKTTTRKAQILVAEFDRLVSTAKQNTEASKRLVSAKLQNELALEKLYNKLLPGLQDVNSGYTYQARTLPRKGDNAPQVIVLVRGQEIKEKQTRLQRLLNRQTKQAESKTTKKNLDRKDRSEKVGRESKAKAQQADTRRISM